jgi:hypothetical protein
MVQRMSCVCIVQECIVVAVALVQFFVVAAFSHWEE